MYRKCSSSKNTTLALSTCNYLPGAGGEGLGFLVLWADASNQLTVAYQAHHSGPTLVGATLFPNLARRHTVPNPNWEAHCSQTLVGGKLFLNLGRRYTVPKPLWEAHCSQTLVGAHSSQTLVGGTLFPNLAKRHTVIKSC